MELAPSPRLDEEVAGMMVEVGVKGELRVPVALEEVEVLAGPPNAILDIRPRIKKRRRVSRFDLFDSR